ncbi:hypothetical protein HPB50_006764 [Hyalomma asiaticum]|uniref:Uncharacterized protein n=1 Tax=Hyalomma asiaticum TaxID=266040 RepID=A0ACB7SNB0_HYAAI|nr:hypothetical protein HPB50_006764 [Hyalomma asiaticum]
MALPSKSCLDKHMQSFKSEFGFNTKILSALQLKTQGMDKFSCHGGLVFDEVELSENISAKPSGELTGFVDLGPFTEDSTKSTTSDHGLVVMFQPFQGKWTQVLGVFAAHGNVKAPVLSKILLEATLLAEKAGLFVDFRTSAGASWNRSLWKRFGIKAELTTDDILQSVQGTEAQDEDCSDDTGDDVTVAPEGRDESVSATDALDYLRKLRIFVEKSGGATEAVHKNADGLESFVMQSLCCCTRQKTITDYFK